jgi:hypothetical protein
MVTGQESSSSWRPVYLPPCHCSITDIQIIAQKFLHDAIYTLGTWTRICCKPRPDINNRNLEMTERLILRHISWLVSRIANEQTIADRHEQIMGANISDIQRNYCQLYLGERVDTQKSTSYKRSPFLTPFFRNLLH